MKIEKKHIKYIQDEFALMQSRKDFLSLLNYAKPIIYGDDCFPFELKQITYYTNPKRSRKAYKEFQVKKKSGGTRTIYAPENGLKAIQKTLALILQCVFKPHQAAKGFVMGKSIVDNAKEHVGQNYVYNIDLKDFFPTIEQARVWACLQLKPFNLNSNRENLEASIKEYSNKKDLLYLNMEGGKVVFLDGKTGFIRDFTIKEVMISRIEIANIIAAISCTEMLVEREDNESWKKVKRNVLPQGAPTSPVFSNIICQRLDRRLTGLAKRFNLNYTRYADDITFSSMYNVYQDNSAFLQELTRIVNDQKFEIKQTKTRLQKRGFRQEVTGLVVNDKVNVKKRYVKQVRMWLYYWEKYGYFKAEAIFLRDYTLDKGHIKNVKPNFQNVLSGKLEYLKMVKGVENTMYIALNKRFEKLCGYKNPIDIILSEWENNGIESVMKIYKFKENE